MSAQVVASGPHAAQPLLTLHDVHAFLGQSHILQGISFDVEVGQTTVLLGRNGAGKSTTLRTIMGIVGVARGRIQLDAERLDGRPAHVVARHGVAFVPEDREVFASLTVEENLKLAQRSRSARAEAGLTRAYEMFPDLVPARGRSAGALSGGQQQMLAIARALVNPSRVLLVDEPTKGLAPIIVQSLAALFGRLHDAGETILLVEQNLEFARLVGDRFYILDEGRIVHAGRMDQLGDDPEILRRYIGV